VALSSDSFRNEVEVLGAAGRKKRKKEKKKRRAWLEERERLGEQQGKLRCCWKLVVALVEREAMATENPVRMLSSGGGMRAGIGGRVGLGDGLRGGASILGGGGGGGGAHHHHHHSSSSMTQEGEAELGLLLNRRTRLELSEKKKGVVVPRQRSGSAPPSVEGSFAAMGGLFSYLSKNPKSGSGGARGVSKAQSGEGGGDFVVLDAEQQQRSDPAYLIYYYNNINLNPRLPPPLISWENYRLAQRLQSGMEVVGGGIGDKRRLRSLDDSSSSKSLFSTQPVLPTHREEPEPLEDDIPSPIGNLVRQSSSDWANRRVDHLMGRSSSTGLGAPHPKSLVDLIQEDFPRTPSPVYQLSRSSSRAANEESGDATPTLDMQLTHLQDVLLTSVTPAELNAIVAAGLGSRSLTPIPGVASIHGQSSGLAAPVPRTASLDFPVSSSTQSASPGLATIGSVSGRSGGTMNLTSAEARSVALNRAASGSTAEFVSALGAMLGYTGEQKSQYARTGPIGVPIASNKSGSVSPAYYGSPPGVGMVMPYNNSPLTSPVLPGSPVGAGTLSTRRDDRSLHLSSGTSRSSAAAAGTSYSGWQSQRSPEKTVEIQGSTLLEEYKNSKTQHFELSDITGHVVEFRYVSMCST
jgi:hypothetical protein